MKLRKRYFLLISLALVPFYKMFHSGDYCFGDEDLLIIAILSVVFIIALIAVIFHNLYTISERRELFNYRPLIIGGVFFISLFIGLNFHQENFQKNKMQFFIIKNKELDKAQIKLFADFTFEFKTTFDTYNCVKKGTYYFKNDSLLLNKEKKDLNESFFDSIYIYNKANKLLKPMNSLLPKFILQERK